MRATIWGCRGTLASPGPETIQYGGQTSCIVLDLDGTPVPLDQLPLGIAFREGRPAHRAIRITGGDGVHREIEVTAFPLCPQRDVILGAVAVFWERPPAGS